MTRRAKPDPDERPDPNVWPCGNDDCDTFHRTRDDQGRLLCTKHRSRRVNGKLVPCQAPAVKGTRTPACRTHGASAKHVRADAAANVRRDAALTAAAKLIGDPGDRLHATEHLLDELARSRLVVRILGEEVAQLDQLVAVTERGEKARAMYTMWREERELHAKLAKLALDADIDERLTTIAETAEEAVVVALTRALDEAGLDHETRRTILLGFATAARDGVHVRDKT